jgi:crotonobetainyl-CoA:carnitine CoA-transferase CaiB-like acyl-CoA transferase
LRLADKADVVVENFRPGTAERLGVGPDVLCARNPQLIYARISGFGQTGPWSHKPGYDLAVQGLSGLMAITGDPDGPPYKLGVSIADLTTGLMAVQAILAALFRRERTGEGDVLDVAMLDSVAALLTFQAQRALTADEPPRRMGNAHPAIAPYESVRTADGWLNLAVGNDTLWARFCDALDQPGWAADPRFATNADRVSHRPALLAAIEGVFAEHPRAHWQGLLEPAGVPCGMILEVEEVLALPSLRERGAIGQVLHPLLGALELLGHPVRFANAATRLSPPPELNAHRDEVLADWGV